LKQIRLSSGAFKISGFAPIKKKFLLCPQEKQFINLYYLWFMNSLLHLIGLLWKSLFLLNFIVTLILLYPVYFILFLNEQNFPVAFKLMRAWAKYLVFTAGIKTEVVLEEDLPKSPYIICPNHTSYLDILLTYCVFPDYFVFMGKKELSKLPLFNIFFKKMNILVDRKSSTGSHKSLLRAAEEIDKGRNIAIFPEGGISPHAPSLMPFKNGPFKLAIDKQVPIVPVTFLNTWNLLQDAAYFKAKSSPGSVTIVVHKPLPTLGKTEDNTLVLKQSIYSTIHNQLESYLTENNFDTITANRYGN
jgi:1-acyl-sn-glycerol-3-phosphate acyltransferase